MDGLEAFLDMSELMGYLVRCISNLAFSIGVGTTLGEMAAEITDTESD